MAPKKGYKQTPERVTKIREGQARNAGLSVSEYQKQISTEYWNRPGSREAARERLAARRAAGEIVGSGGWVIVPLEVREKISKSHIGLKASLETRQKLSQSHTGIPRLDKVGPLSHFWRGGNSYKFRGKDWGRLRRLILERDNHTCQSCGKYKAPRLSVHHIIEWREEEDNSLTNLITLCNSCHKKLHSYSLCLMIMRLPVYQDA